MKKVKGYIQKNSKENPENMSFFGGFSVAQIVSELSNIKDKILQDADNKIKEVDNKLENVDEKLEMAEADAEATKRSLEQLKEDVEDIFVKLKEELTEYVMTLEAKDGEDADEEKIIAEITKKLPIIDEKQILEKLSKKIPVIDENKLIKSLLKKIPENKASLKVITEKVEVDPMSVIDKIMALDEEKLKKLKLKTSNIDGLEQTFSAFRNQLSRGYLHGGGISNITGLIEAGTNITITGDGTSSSPYVINGSEASPLTTKGDIYVYSTANTRLPVGTDGQVLVADSTETTGLKWIDSAGVVNTLRNTSDDSTTAATSLYQMTSTIPVEFRTSGGISLIYLDEANARVGIGTNSPDGNLHVFNSSAGSVTANASADDLVVENTSDGGISILGGTSSTGSVVFGDGSSNFRGALRYSHSSDSMSFTTAGTQQGVLTSAGYLGLGITSPSKKLHVAVSTGDDGILLSKSGSANNIFRVSMDGTSDQAEMFLYQSGAVIFAIRPNNPGYINTTQNFGIGNTSPATRLDITGFTQTGSGAAGILNLAQTWNTTGTPTALKLNITDTASNASSLLFDFQKGGVSQLKLSKSGALTGFGDFYTPGGVQGNTRVVTGANSYFIVAGRLNIGSPSDGVALIRNYANTDFGRLQLGGTTSSFPALKRSGATIQARLADDSDYATFHAKTYSVNGTAGFTGTGAYTNFTIEGGIITNAS